MQHPFRVVGNVIEVLHYKIFYLNNEGTEEYVYTLNEVEAAQEKIEIDFKFETDATIERIDTSSYEWMEKIDVGTQDNAMQKAIEIYNMGEQAYLDSINAPSKMESLEKENRQLKARVSAQEENSKFLEDCLVEMASVVYS